MTEETAKLLETRKKLEIRTWILRGSLGLNVAGITGTLVYLVTQACK